jgi:hypothetical protein
MSPQDLHHRASREPTSIEVAGVNGIGGAESHVPWRAVVQFSTPPPDEEVRMRLSWQVGDDRGEKDSANALLRVYWGNVSPLTQALGASVLYRFDARQIAAAAFSADENPAVEYDGRNTAVVLAALKLEHEEAFNRVESELRKIVPNVQRLLVRRARIPSDNGHPQPGNKVFLDFKGAPDVPAHAASEGTLVTLALLTALCSPARPRVLLLDDIDQSLHPQAQAQLMREIKGLLEGFPEVQIVATTHSPYVLDELDPADVIVFAPCEDGAVACRRLSEHPQAAQVKGMLTAGQLWTLDPESRWVVGEG